MQQIRTACDKAKLGAARLADREKDAPMDADTEQTLSGQEFLIQHVIPNFHFHVVTAYAILRHNSAGIGKRNYLGDMPYREAA